MTLDQLISRVQAARGKPMEIHELPELANETGALCGLWLDTVEKDIVIHAPSSSALHRQQFLLHELAHMILLHDRDDKVFTPRGILPGITTVAVVKALARDNINDELELAAEALADEMAAAIRRRGQSRFSEVFG
ncbi:MAG: ImmA/IrrE family metallo-endopeptidase [Microbacterium sp.]|uniref:ImmA/IrrE family metallo-endopeptidase n=1 Tax=Microbacterium sp. TaxID=51671 RepID=UPI001AC5E8A7|nr:ImmA/IrrE family metallo-endopeptidase [Microbacterium sp.]MBN9214791.1 ImmA/IrrE family metallo-endopeptidase [Microbacterium sp.]